MPIRWGAEFLGVLVIDAAPQRTFSSADAELLGLFAAHAAVAIHNAQLVAALQEELDERVRAEAAEELHGEALRQRSREAEALHSLADRVNASLSLD